MRFHLEVQTADSRNNLDQIFIFWRFTQYPSGGKIDRYVRNILPYEHYPILYYLSSITSGRRTLNPWCIINVSMSHILFPYTLSLVIPRVSVNNALYPLIILFSSRVLSPLQFQISFTFHETHNYLPTLNYSLYNLLIYFQDEFFPCNFHDVDNHTNILFKSSLLNVNTASTCIWE